MNIGIKINKDQKRRWTIDLKWTEKGFRTEPATAFVTIKDIN